jgi:hypothetical protein
MKIYGLDKYGPHLKGPNGWIVGFGEEGYQHKFGGNSWDIARFDGCDTPTLLLALDLQDPKLSSLPAMPLNELPLCSFVNSNAWEKKQTYQINPGLHTVSLVDLGCKDVICVDDADRLPIPFIERHIRLLQMKERENPIDEQAYWDNLDNFIGGASFIRVLGSPIWLQWVEEETCTCGLPMNYVCSIGYEDLQKPGDLIPGAHFFIGEAALYFFLCAGCLKVSVISQST